jgi:hypothetical protein
LAEEIHRALEVSNIQMAFEEIANSNQYSPPSPTVKGNHFDRRYSSRITALLPRLRKDIGTAGETIDEVASPSSFLDKANAGRARHA